MTVTIGDCLRLPALRGANLLTDARGLDWPVTAVSVLEYSEVTPIQQTLVDQIHYQGHELVLTAFADVRDNVTAQCENIRRLKSQGDTGLVLFYVGILMPKVDPLVVALANSLDYAIIMMPLNDPHPAYSEVISDVMQAIFLDHMHNPMFAMDLLEQATKLPPAQHTVDTVVRMVAERLHVGVALFNRDGQVITACAWPTTASEDWAAFARAHFDAGVAPLDARHQYWEKVSEDPRLGTVWLLLLQDGGTLDVYARGEVVSTLQIALNLWGQNPTAMSRGALLSAIMAGDPVQIHRLAAFYHVALADLRQGWLIPQFTGQDRARQQGQLVALVGQTAPVALCERYDNLLFLFPRGHLAPGTMQAVSAKLAAATKAWGYPVPPVVCPVLADVAALKAAAALVKTAAIDATKIFPHRATLSLGDLRLAARCRAAVGTEAAENAAKRAAARQLVGLPTDPTLFETASAYLLDCDGKVAAVAQQLFVHPNTVSYRLHKLSTRLGFTVGAMPDSDWLYELAGSERLLSES
ncbi:PucR family transcriptional regulator ligand-binding domain-containing protein [Lacticaseibacillus nasuensis]|uniref:PucR family transcriptional regulator ligand-binding domain-containing protein n=1 Tax=Lacticaseibacillus nasuensis TaxID=944671 RepID=UPI00224542C5|nr:PucR family transcriptional regulator [Lacticaseibacillus nasuensis]MCX2455542.1 PucR family transcriptional regulator [Lacticaseibacillus nasuensis]